MNRSGTDAGTLSNEIASLRAQLMSLQTEVGLAQHAAEVARAEELAA